MLFNTVRSQKIDPKRLITHRFKLDRILDAYDTFGNAAKTKALKVIIEAYSDSAILNDNLEREPSHVLPKPQPRHRKAS
jgi:hypothetical protein